ncbi:FMN-dependent NADH-azoreductase [Alteromonas aestuariivivens]|uniref:FMN dependent NADH:quinone oxidoreductase n=1 Tax=Alteromonas aestuariivivens TaxID=1938339 RepID=A0A3D8MAQ3_9ALTE|nr:NAD(P)H-dependent oxidoreductase [Alteromonas aestuariivivens]RDV27352.1 FMN-dependent NADH-azoreductase [Alteromonas aestuariivivens]
MSNILVIYSSINGASGHSSQLAKDYVASLSGRSGVSVVERNLSSGELGHLSAEEMAAWMTPANTRTEEQEVLASQSDLLIEEVKAADEIVLAVPMYNFGIPSVLKAWFDRIARAGVTFRYTESGPVGLLEGKRVTIFATRGGMYQGTELDTQSQYLKHFLGFIGLTDVRFVYAEGLNMGEKSAEAALIQAKQKIVELIA